MDDQTVGTGEPRLWGGGSFLLRVLALAPQAELCHTERTHTLLSPQEDR